MAKRLPKAVWSTHGSIPVRLVDAPLGDSLGAFDPVKRELHVDKGVNPENMGPTFFHELTHVALWDSGIQHFLDHAQTEGVCDAMGLFLSGMWKAGYLVIKAPPQESEE